jgi:hypothetical protein
MKRRRGRALRRRYGRAGYRIGARGLEKPGTTTVIPGLIYAMGASSSPSLIKIVQVTSDRIRYRPHTQYGDTSEKAIERWIGEDLIAQGERTFKTRYGVSPQTWIHMSEDERREQLRGRL